MTSARSSKYTPLRLAAPLGEPWLEIQWGDGYLQKLPALILRGYCPCAQCQGHGGTIAWQSGHDTELKDITSVGNYALGITWGDGHSAGIYSFEYLRRLSELYTEHGDRLPEVHPVYPAGEAARAR